MSNVEEIFAYLSVLHHLGSRFVLELEKKNLTYCDRSRWIILRWCECPPASPEVKLLRLRKSKGWKFRVWQMEFALQKAQGAALLKVCIVWKNRKSDTFLENNAQLNFLKWKNLKKSENLIKFPGRLASAPRKEKQAVISIFRSTSCRK